MPRRRKQSDFEILIEVLLDVGWFIGKVFLFIFKGIFSLLNFGKSGFKIHLDEGVRKNPNSKTHLNWNLSLLNDLEWKRFEEVVSNYYRLVGYRSEVTRMGADGGVDVVLYQHGADTPAILMSSARLGVKESRSEGCSRTLRGNGCRWQFGYGVFATTSSLYSMKHIDWAVW